MVPQHDFMNLFDVQPVLGLAEETCQFMELQAAVRKRLGENAYLLDVILELLLRTLNEMDAQDAASEGFEDGRKLHLIVQHEVWDRESEFSSHPFAKRVRAFIQQNPLDIDDHKMQIEVYYIAVADAWKTYCLREMSKSYMKQCQKADILPKSAVLLYNEILTALGDGAADMERLMEIFAIRHYAVPPLQAYAQGIASHLNYEMMQHDDSGLHTAFRLWLDSGIGTME